MAALEKNNPDLSAEVKAKFADLMDEVPGLKAEYQKLDGPKGLLRQRSLKTRSSWNIAARKAIRTSRWRKYARLWLSSQGQ